MGKTGLLRNEAEVAFSAFMGTLDGLTESQAWARVAAANDGYLHTDGSVQGIVLHVATCKKAYASFAFRNSEHRWRDLANEVEPYEAHWESAVEYLRLAHEYWMASWSKLSDEDLDKDVLHFSGALWPAHKVLTTVTQHDCYHAGQIEVVKFATNGSPDRPPSTAEDIRTYCVDLPTW